MLMLGDNTFMKNSKARLLPIVSLGAEHLVIGHLMLRNIPAYKAPPNNAGYDLICIHPKRAGSVVRVQVKSRYQLDCDGQFLINQKTPDDFDYLILAFLNIDVFYKRKPLFGEFADRKPVFYTLTKDWVKTNLVCSGWTKIQTKGREQELAEFKNEKGFEKIAEALGVPSVRSEL